MWQPAQPVPLPFQLWDESDAEHSAGRAVHRALGAAGAVQPVLPPQRLLVAAAILVLVLLDVVRAVPLARDVGLPVGGLARLL
jgi:hypothetical protein